MIKSERILPIRIYDNLFDQNRFNINCPDDKCGTELVFPTNELPMFQFTRQASLEAPTLLYLKSTCDDYFIVGGQIFRKFQKQVPEQASVFMEPTSSNFYQNYPPQVTLISSDPFAVSPIQADFTTVSCNNLVPKIVGGSYHYDTTFALNPAFILNVNSNTSKFIFKIIVEKFKSTAGFRINIYTGVDLIKEINSTGNYEFEFTSTSFDVSVEFQGFIGGDDFAISYIQVQNIDYTFIGQDSVQINAGNLKVLPTGSTDIITYCGDTSDYNAPAGIYYYVITCGTETYFSEVFTLKKIKDMQAYYQLKWYNDCDINNSIIYSHATLGCSFYNNIYLDAGLFDPEYETTEVDVNNGAGDKIPTNKRWQKTITMDVLQSPGFLTDALSGVFIHENIYLKEPLNINQDLSNNFFKILGATPQVTDILDNCYQYVKLKLLLEDRFTGAGCCNVTEIIPCPPLYNYLAGSGCGGIYDYSVNVTIPPQTGDGLFDCNSLTLVPVLPTDIIFCEPTGVYYSFVLSGGIYISRTYPSIIYVNDDGIKYRAQGKVLPYYFAKLYYSYNGGAYIYYGSFQSTEDGQYSAYFPVNLSSGASDFKIKITMASYGCEMATTDPYDII